MVPKALVPKAFLDQKGLEALFGLVGEALGQPDLFRLLYHLYLTNPYEISQVINGMFLGAFTSPEDEEVLSLFKRVFGTIELEELKEEAEPLPPF